MMKKLQSILLLAAAVLLAACGGGGAKVASLEFTNYEKSVDATTPDGVPASLRLCFAIPQGEGEALIVDAEKDIIAAAMIAEAVGGPEGETLQAIADSYETRFKSGMAEGELEAPCIYQLQIACQYQNPQVVVLHVTDGVYGNGGPQEYLRMVSLADGHIVERNALTTLTDAEVRKLALQYADGDTKEFLRENNHEDFWVAPDSEGCKIKLQTGSHFFADFVVPMDIITPYLTDEGKSLFGVASEEGTDQDGTQDAATSTDISYPVQHILNAYQAALEKKLPKEQIKEELAGVVEEAKTGEIYVKGKPFGISCSKAVVHDYNVQFYGVNIVLQFIPDEGTDFHLANKRGPYGKPVYCLIYGKDDMIMKQTVTWATSDMLGVTLSIDLDKINKWKKFSFIELTEMEMEFR